MTKKFTEIVTIVLAAVIVLLTFGTDTLRKISEWIIDINNLKYSWILTVLFLVMAIFCIISACTTGKKPYMYFGVACLLILGLTIFADPIYHFVTEISNCSVAKTISALCACIILFIHIFPLSSKE